MRLLSVNSVSGDLYVVLYHLLMDAHHFSDFFFVPFEVVLRAFPQIFQRGDSPGVLEAYPPVLLEQVWNGN